MITYQADVTDERPKAICCSLNGDGFKHWIPVGQIQAASEISHTGDAGRLIVSEWFAHTARLPIGETSTMAFEQKPGLGSLFKNKRREQNDKAPNLTGEALLQLEDGRLVKLDLGAWTKESAKAGKWLSLTVKVKGSDQQNTKQAERRPNAADPAAGTAMDDDIPF